MKVIFYIKYSARHKSNIPFDSHHPNPHSSNVQRPSITLEYDRLVALIGLLSTNKNTEDTIKDNHIKTDVRRNDVKLILLALFIS